MKSYFKPFGAAKTRQALLFPGQGSEAVGMAQDLDLHNPEIAGWFAAAGRICETGPEGAPGQDRAAQAAVFTYGAAAMLTPAGKATQAEVILGHSMGIYAALVAAGALERAEALHLVLEAERLARQVNQQQAFCMAVVLGLLGEDVENICQEVTRSRGQVVSASCYNTAKQVVISGRQVEVAEVLARALHAGAFLAEQLKILTPFHSPWMKDVSREFSKYLQKISLRDCAIPIVEPLTGQWLRQSSEVRDYLGVFLHEPQFWGRTLTGLIAEGLGDFVDMGPGFTLGRMLQWIDRRVTVRPLLVAAESPGSASVRRIGR